MKNAIPILVLLLAGCVRERRAFPMDEPRPETPEERAAKRVARESFDQFRRALMERDAVAVLRRMSLQMCSDWFFHRMSDKADPRMAGHVVKLDAPTRIDLDVWFKKQKDVQLDFGNRRPDLLPASVLYSPWFVGVWTSFFKDEAEDQRRLAAEMNVSDVYVDGPGATVMVKMAGTTTMMYSMTVENGEWKVDWVVRRPMGGVAQ
ncbi:MAG: hypothetical protein HY716_10510 [Planctomycetes bacterium]|nr:hypothetical protein [Planctomycetota bacterium]